MLLLILEFSLDGSPLSTSPAIIGEDPTWSRPNSLKINYTPT